MIYGEKEHQEEPEFYAYVMHNKSTYDAMIKANYFGTTLYSRQALFLDDGRYETVVPEWGFLSFDEYHRDGVMFKYFVQAVIFINTYLMKITARLCMHTISLWM